MSKPIKIMTFNIWHDGRAGKQPLEQTAKVIKMGQADIVGLQEVHKNASKLADMLGWHHIQQRKGVAVLSRFKIIGLTDKKLGVKIKHDSGQMIYVFNLHLMHAPYQPYQLLNIPYYDAAFLKTEKEAVAAARKARGETVKNVIAEIKAIKDTTIPVFITGDFNEPSHLDWTEAAAKASRHPIKVAYPTSSDFAAAGLLDAWRVNYPDEMTKPGYTWTPCTKEDDPKDHHDRIDFVLFRKGTAKLKSVVIVGENKNNADIVVSPYPSDHRAVVATFLINK